MKKKILAILMCAFILGSLVACGGNNGNGATTSDSAPSIPQEDPLNLDGEYTDSKEGTAYVKIEYSETGQCYGIVMELQGMEEDGAKEGWMLTAYDAGDGKLEYSDAIKLIVDLPLGNGETDTIVESENGEGYFTVTDKGLLWDGAADEYNKKLLFVKK